MNLLQQKQVAYWLKRTGAPVGLRQALGDYSEDDRNTFNRPPYNEQDVFNGGAGGTDAGVSVQAAMTQGAIGVPPMIQKNIISYALYPFAIGTGNGAVTILPYNAKRTLLIIQNQSAADDLYVNFGSDASVNSGLILAAGVGLVLDTSPPNNSISVFYNNATPQGGVIIEGAPST